MSSINQKMPELPPAVSLGRRLTSRLGDIAKLTWEMADPWQVLRKAARVDDAGERVLSLLAQLPLTSGPVRDAAQEYLDACQDWRETVVTEPALAPLRNLV